MIFGLFGKKTGEAAIKKHATRIADKRAQAPDRWDSIQALGRMIADAKKKGATEEDRKHAGMAVAALLPRFGYTSDPSITDNDEKEEACRIAVEAGELAIPHVAAFLRKNDAIGWPLKILERVGSTERVVTEVLAILADMDTEYERDPSRKLHMLQALEGRADPRVCDAIGRFLDDVNEGARFNAVGALFHQAEVETLREKMAAMASKDDSVRVRARVLEGFAEKGWAVGDREATLKALPVGWKLDKNDEPVPS